MADPLFRRAAAQSTPRAVFHDRLNLTGAEIAAIDKGEVVTKVLEPPDRRWGILVFGAVYVTADLTRFAPACRDLAALAKERVYQAVHAFCGGGEPLKPSDFYKLELTRQDIDALRDCRPGDCDIQILELSGALQQVNWKSPDRYDQVNRIFRERIYRGMTGYMKGGLRTLGSYRDRQAPLDLYEATKTTLASSYYLPPQSGSAVYRHILDFPQAKMPGAEDIFYWEKIDFGMEPTIRLNHLSLFPMGMGSVPFVAVNKQIYSTRYIRAAVQLFYCARDERDAKRPGFYLVEMNVSRLPDFPSLKLAVARRVATGHAVASARDFLTIYRRRLAP